MSEKILRCIPTNKPQIPAGISRKVLDSIKSGKYYTKEFLQYEISVDEIERLRRFYKEKLKQIPLQKRQPRYLHFYHMIQDKIPQISCGIRYKNNKPVVRFYPQLADTPSISSILLDRIVVVKSNDLFHKYKSVRILGDHIIEALENFMNGTDAIYPDEKYMQQLVEWIKKSQNGEPCTIFIQICPDYAAQSMDELGLIYQHTFNSLGSGIGLIAKRILDILPNLKELLNKLQINPRIIVAMADYEAFSESNLKRIGITKSEFIKKANLSRIAFENRARDILPIETCMFSDLCGGEKAWQNKINEVMDNFNNRNFGYSEVNMDIFLDIAKHRKMLYMNWFGDKGHIEEYIPIAMKQATEYTAVGFYITNMFKNCLVLGADNIKFIPFYNFYRTVPALYFKKFYC